MIDTVIVSGGMIQKDFALDFLKKNKTEKVDLIAAEDTRNSIHLHLQEGKDWKNSLH